MKIRFSIAAMAIALISCKSAPASEFTVGSCKFDLPATEAIKVDNSDNQRAIISFKYKLNGVQRKSNIELLCISKSLSDALPDDFEKRGSIWEFQGGAEGSSTTIELTGQNWHGFQAEYLQSNACILTVGSVDESHSFRAETCDEEGAIKSQAPALTHIIKSLKMVTKSH